MTKTALTIPYLLSKRAFAEYVDNLLKSEAEDSTLTMTIKRSEYGEFCVSDVMLLSGGTSP